VAAVLTHVVKRSQLILTIAHHKNILITDFGGQVRPCFRKLADMPCIPPIAIENAV
jgi:hypothetical protein